MASSQCTSGNFKLEIDAERFFDSVINETYFFNEKQVVGRRLFDDKPINREENGQNLIPDRILHPTQEAFKSGWKWGPIGVELKKSNIKLGPVFGQVLEQRQSVYLSKHLYYTRIMPLLFAIFPVEEIKHNLHSISMTQLILSCTYKQYNRVLKFSSGNVFVLSLGESGIETNPNWKPTTRKGHRG